MWTQANGLVDLGVRAGATHSFCTCMSGDKTTVAGWNTYSGHGKSSFWRSNAGHILLGELPGHVSSSVLAISDDGTICAGNSWNGLRDRATLWKDGNVIDLGALPGGDFSNVWGMSSDGKYIVGQSSSSLGNRAYRWSQQTGMEDLGTMPGASRIDPYSITDDGQLIVGTYQVSGVARAFYWTPSTGMADLTAHLISIGVDMTGITLVQAYDVSDEGLAICGQAATPDGLRAFVAYDVVPQPPYSMTLKTTAIEGGLMTSGQITFADVIGTDRAVRLIDDSAFLLTTTYCVVPAGQPTGTFTIWTYGVPTSTDVTVSASFAGVSRTRTITLIPASLDLLWVNPTAVVGGNPSMGSVRLKGKAPSGGALVSLHTSHPTVANHAASTLVSHGASVKQFPVSTFGVNATTVATISATYRSVTRTATIQVRAAALASLSLTPSSVQGGTPLSGTVTMSGKTGSLGRAVLLSSSSPKLIVPASVYVPPQKFSWSFTALTQTVLTPTQRRLAQRSERRRLC